MFKILAGIVLISIVVAGASQGFMDGVSTGDIGCIIGIAMIGAGLDTIFFKK